MTTGTSGTAPAPALPGSMPAAPLRGVPAWSAGRMLTKVLARPRRAAANSALRSDRRVMVLVAVLAAAAAVLFLAVLVHLSWARAPLHVPWWAWAAAFAAGEMVVVHVQVRRDSHTFSLTDLVLAAALCLMQPAGLVTAQVAGTGLALLLHRRQSGLKLAFNVAQFALGDCVAALLFAWLSRGLGWSSPWEWGVALIAVAATTMTGNICVFAVLSLSEGATSARDVKRLLASSLPFSVGTATVGLLIARTAVLDPAALVLLAAPSILMIAAYRAYTHGRQQQENLRLLHEVTSVLYDSADVSDGLGNFLTAVRGAFKAGVAEIVLLGDDGPEGATISRSRSDGEVITLLPLEQTDDAAALIGCATPTGPLSTRTSTGQNPALEEYVTRRGLKDAMLAVLRTEERVAGLLLVASRLGEVSTFTGSDVTLLETFARHVATSLERGRLHADLRQLAELQDKLRHQAMHDALTGLPNRTLFQDRAHTALQLATRTAVWPAVLYLDLDGFKPVNDTHGHEAGDVLLRAFAQRLAGCLRGADTAARLGGDEFAVLVNGPIDAEGVERVVGRIHAQLAAPIELGGGRQATIGASIGVALADSGTGDVETLLRRADTAMYTAKRARDGRHVLYHPGLVDHSH